MNRKVFLSAVMKRSHILIRTMGMSKSEALKQAWFDVRKDAKDIANTKPIIVVMKEDMRDTMSPELTSVEITKEEHIFSKDSKMVNQSAMFDMVEMQPAKKVSTYAKVRLELPYKYIGYGLYLIGAPQEERIDMGRYIKIVIYTVREAPIKLQNDPVKRKIT